MSGHASGHEQGRNLCEALSRQVESLCPGVRRDELRVSCALWHPPNNRFTYVYHSRRKPSLDVYFRSPPEFPSSTIPSSVSVGKRKKLKGGWSQAFPFFMRVSDPSSIRDVAQLLLNISYPLAIRVQSVWLQTDHAHAASGSWMGVLLLI